MSQMSLLDWKPPEPFDGKGETFVANRDGRRLGKQCQAVYDAMKCGDWFTLRQLPDAAGAPEASASARLRDLRRYGFNIEHEHVTGGLWRYRLSREEKV